MVGRWGENKYIIKKLAEKSEYLNGGESMKTGWKLKFECSNGFFLKTGEIITIESTEKDESRAKSKAETQLRKKYKNVFFKESVLILSSDNPKSVWHINYTTSPTFFKYITGKAEVKASNQNEATDLLKSYLKRGNSKLYVSIDSVTSDSLEKAHSSGAGCSNCIFSVKDWPNIYCSKMTKRSFGEEVMTAVESDGICDNYCAKSTKSNSNYHRK